MPSPPKRKAYCPRRFHSRSLSRKSRRYICLRRFMVSRSTSTFSPSESDGSGRPRCFGLLLPEAGFLLLEAEAFGLLAFIWRPTLATPGRRKTLRKLWCSKASMLSPGAASSFSSTSSWMGRRTVSSSMSRWQLTARWFAPSAQTSASTR